MNPLQLVDRPGPVETADDRVSDRNPERGRQRSSPAQRLASLSMDLDNKWAYLKTRGDDRWESFPSYFDLVVPRILSHLNQFGLRITFFVVGQDAERPENHAALERIVEEGHEIGNHSFHHEPWLHTYTREQIVEELTRTEQAVAQFYHQPLTGFRGPGFSYSRDVLEVLLERGYGYDATTFPTFLGPLARTYYFLKTRLNSDDRVQRKGLFGSWTDGFQRLTPYRWRGPDTKEDSESSLLEIPVTTVPLIRAPFHLSYVMFLARWSEELAVCYFNTALRLCRLGGVEPSILLHPLDFLGCDDDRDLAFFPAMDIPYERKRRVMTRVFESLSRRYQVLPMGAFAQVCARRKLSARPLPTR